eukprot:gene17053-8569_t
MDDKQEDRTFFTLSINFAWRISWRKKEELRSFKRKQQFTQDAQENGGGKPPPTKNKKRGEPGRVDPMGQVSSKEKTAVTGKMKTKDGAIESINGRMEGEEEEFSQGDRGIGEKRWREREAAENIRKKAMESIGGSRDKETSEGGV